MKRTHINILAIAVCAILVIGIYVLYNKMGPYYHYMYEYDYGDFTVRRYDNVEVTLELLKKGKVVDRVKAKIDKINAYYLHLGLYFDPSGQVLITGEKSTDFNKYWRCPSLPYLYTYVIKKNNDCFLLDYLTDMSLRSVEQITERLEYLQHLQDEGRFYAMNYGYPQLDTLYSYEGANPVAVKMKVLDRKGNIVYSNGR